MVADRAAFKGDMYWPLKRFYYPTPGTDHCVLVVLGIAGGVAFFISVTKTWPWGTPSPSLASSVPWGLLARHGVARHGMVWCGSQWLPVQWWLPVCQWLVVQWWLPVQWWFPVQQHILAQRWLPAHHGRAWGGCPGLSVPGVPAERGCSPARLSKVTAFSFLLRQTFAFVQFRGERRLRLQKRLLST